MRDTWITTRAIHGTAFNFNTVSDGSTVLALKLRDNTFYATNLSSVTGSCGHIESRATQGAEFYWYWQGNTFYSGGITSMASGARIFAWFDAGSSTNACRLIQISPSIHNYDTFPSPPIINMTPVTMYGPLKITPPEFWNRS